MQRVHHVVLVAYAALVALVEGPAQMLAIAALVTTALTGGFSRYRPGIAELGILLWAIAGVPGTLLDPGHHSSGETTRPLLALTFLVGARGLGRADHRLLTHVAWAFSVGCVLNGSVGLAQFWIDDPLPISKWLLINPKSGQIFVPGEVFHVHASSGLFYNRLKLAHVGMVGAFVLALVVLSKDVRPRTRIVAAVASLPFLAGLAFTYARMALLSVAAAAVSMSAVLKRWVVLAVAAIGAAVGGVALLSTRLGTRRMEGLSEDFDIRRNMFGAAVDIFMQHPLLGVGHGVYRNAVSALPERGLKGVHLTSPHNVWLQVLAETGLVGFVGFNVAVAFCLWSVARRVARPGPWSEQLLDRVALLSVLAILFVGLMHFALHHAPVGMVFWTLAGVCVRPRRDGEAEEA